MDLAVLKKNDEEAKLSINAFALIVDKYSKTNELQPSTQRRDQYNVEEQISGIFKIGRTKYISAITDEQMSGQLLRNIDNSVDCGDIRIDYALKILPHVFVCLRESRGAKWTDIYFENTLLQRQRIRQHRNILILCQIKS